VHHTEAMLSGVLHVRAVLFVHLVLHRAEPRRGATARVCSTALAELLALPDAGVCDKVGVHRASLKVPGTQGAIVPPAPLTGAHTHDAALSS
jgi:hypothetical protein